jgi:hypothetical protein
MGQPGKAGQSEAGGSQNGRAGQGLDFHCARL